MDEVHQHDFDSWFSLTNWEQQCIDEVEGSPDLETQIQGEKDFSSQKLWLQFQNSATCVAQLYKDRHQNISLWVPFQNAAGSVTNLYKECIESQKRFIDIGYQSGYQRRNKELLAWAKKRKRHIRREDLIAFLSGKNPPPQRTWNSPRQRVCLEGMRTPPHPRLAFPPPDADDPADEADLQTFREALAVSVPNCTLAGVRTPTSPSNHSRCCRNRPQNPSCLAELNAFIAEEFTRHVEARKRTASTDVIMDSPTHKKSRLT